MGGTSTDVSLCAGDVRITTEGSVGGLPVRVPMMDIHTVGAGGGSMASLDAGGALRVGPQSAGADPGPVCYGKGEQVTVTDANLVLGRIDPERFLGGRMRLDVERAEAALEKFARTMTGQGSGFSGHGVEAARAIVRVVNSNMERAIRVISVERGYDPRDFTLVSFGGAGGLHACALAESLRIPRVLIPVHPGLLSAWGCVASDVVKDFARTVMCAVERRAYGVVRKVFAALEREGVRALQREGFAPEDIVLMRSLDLRYVGQSYEITTPFAGNLAETLPTFHRLHEQHYGHSSPEEPIEIVTARVRAVGQVSQPRLQPIARGVADARAALITRHTMQLERPMKVAVYDREHLKAGNAIPGPALVVEPYATTLLLPNWRGKVDRWGNILLEMTNAKVTRLAYPSTH